MYKRLEVIVNTDALNRDVWQFTYFDREHTLRCTSYVQESRQSTRHKFKPVEWYSQHNGRQNTLDRAPEIPLAVQQQALEMFVEGLTVTRWES